MKKSKKMTRREAILLVVIGLIMGTVFTFGTKYWNAPITQNEAHQVNKTLVTLILSLPILIILILYVIIKPSNKEIKYIDYLKV